MATRKTTATPKTEQKTEQKTERKTEQKSEKKPEQKVEPTSEKKTDQKPDTESEAEPESVTLEQALKEEGEGRTPETIKTELKNAGGPSKMEMATKIMEEMWNDIQSGKVKRKDVIKRFIEEVNLTPKGAATYYGSIKAKLSR